MKFKIGDRVNLNGLPSEKGTIIQVITVSGIFSYFNLRYKYLVHWDHSKTLHHYDHDLRPISPLEQLAEIPEEDYASF